MTCGLRPGTGATRTLVPRQSEAARRGQFGLIYQVAGTDSTVDSNHGGLARLGGSDDAETDYVGHSGFGSAFSLDDSAWGYFPPSNVHAARSRGMSNCWNPNCNRVHNGTYWYALCSDCWTFETGSSRFKKFNMTPAPSAPRCANWPRGCTGTRTDFDAPLDETSTTGSPAVLEGQRVGLCKWSASMPRSRSVLPPAQ